MKKRIFCTLLFLGILLLTGCGQRSEIVDGPLTQEQIARANEAFASERTVTENGLTTGYPTEISCFFTSYYSEPSEIDLQEFLRYCPIDTWLEDSDIEEFQAVMEEIGDTYALETEMLPTAHVTPVHRYRKADVSALLKKYADITVEDLDSTGKAIYLEEYDCFYNFTSDFGPGRFECVGGEKQGDTIRFWSDEAEDGSREVLTIREKDGEYFIQAFEKE